MSGTFGGFFFNPEEFANYMSEQATWNTKILASGILENDNTIMDLIGTKGNIATIPFYKPISADEHKPLNNDGQTDNEPEEISGSKQTAVLIQRMKAFKAQDFTKELTGADPMQHIANSISDYYKQVWENELMNITKAVMAVDELKGHITDIAAVGKDVTDDNKFDETTLIYAQQKALGDQANGFGVAIMHSAIFARLQAKGLVNYDKYTVANAMSKEVSLPLVNGLIPIVTDRHTIDVSGDVPKFTTTIIGKGAFRTCDKTNYEKPYYTDYDAESKAGIEKFYTKQGKVIHPNGLSFNPEAMATDSPTIAELGAKANWTLKFDAKNVKIGQIISNG